MLYKISERIKENASILCYWVSRLSVRQTELSVWLYLYTHTHTHTHTHKRTHTHRFQKRCNLEILEIYMKHTYLLFFLSYIIISKLPLILLSQSYFSYYYLSYLSYYYLKVTIHIIISKLLILWLGESYYPLIQSLRNLWQIHSVMFLYKYLAGDLNRLLGSECS